MSCTSCTKIAIWYSFFPLSFHHEDFYKLSIQHNGSLALWALSKLVRQVTGIELQERDLGKLASGKPYFIGSLADFYPSISYANGWCAVALSKINIGIDLESNSRLSGWEYKVNYLAGRTLIEKSNTPVAAWVKLEAIIKLVGGSISSNITDIESIPTTTDSNWRPIHWLPTGDRFWVRHISAPHGCWAALAAHAPTAVFNITI
ncbi:hypothetical protein V6259_19300 [Marinomonas sp. TI.3.20]|uniref:hypothetical protein n=1 Tax=Marinomonas sp. TI.3.20 TaxID=3121296 RepID=UPI00311FF1E0